MSILSIILVISIFILSWHFIKHLVHKHQNLPPSPFSLPIIGHLHLIRDPIHETLSKLSNRFGPVILLHLGHQKIVHISSPSAAEDCLRHNDTVCSNRPRVLTGDIFGYGCSTIVWIPSDPTWRNYRRISNSQVLSPNPLQLSVGIRSHEVKSMLRQLLQASKDYLIVNIGPALFDLTHDSIMRVLARERYEGEDLKKFRRVMRDVMRVEGISTIVDLFPWLSVFGVKNMLCKKFRVLAQEKDDLISNLVEKNRRKMEKEEEIKWGIGNGNGNGVDVSTNRQKTLIEVLVSLQKSEPEFYTEETIKGLLQVLLQAGTDTTAATIEWGLSLLLNHPKLLKKAQNEIDLRVGRDRLVDESDLTNLPYLRCIMYETLRLYPPAPLLLPHVPSHKCVIGGYNIPPGATMFVNSWAIHHDPNNWAEPETFRPERFEEMEEGWEQMKYKFMPFGSGRRGCPGEGMAMRMAGLTLASLLQCFEWERPGPELIDMHIKPGFSIPKAQPLRAKCRPHEAMVNLLSQD